MSTSHLASMPGEKAESGSALALDARFSTGKAAWALGAALTGNERRVFASCERTIQRGRDAFMEVADALQVVRDGKLYREKYGTFAEYCEKKWQITARYARSICAAADDVKLLREEVRDQKSEVILPRTESQARPLSRLKSDEEKVEVWQEVRELYKDAPDKITAKAVSEAVERRMGPQTDPTDLREEYRLTAAARMETKSKVLPKGIGEGSPSGRGSVSSAGGVGVSAPAPLAQRSEVGGQRSETHAKDAKGAKKGPEHFRIARGKSGLWHIKEAPGWSVRTVMESLVSAEKFLSGICRDPSAVQVTDSGTWETVGYWNSRFSEPGKNAEVGGQMSELHAKGAKKGKRVSRAEQVRAALDAAEPMVRSLGALLKGSPEEARYNVIMSHLDAIGRKWRGK